MEQIHTVEPGATLPLRHVWKLPPLILHPFTGEKGPDRLLEGSRAQLKLHGLIPGPLGDREEMLKLVLSGRYQEFKMLIYIGRDLQRWAEQCLDFAAREPSINSSGFKEQSFLMMLINKPPEKLAGKLKLWGITDQRSIFSRAIGLHCAFEQPPEFASLGAKFLQSYQRFADYLFICYQTMVSYKSLNMEHFTFELYASEEYAAMLAEGWAS